MSINNASDMVVLWNTITGTDMLSDKEDWETLLDLHYEKFKYFYALLKHINLKKILLLSIDEKVNYLKIELDFRSESQAEKYSDKLRDAEDMVSFPYKNYFTIEHEIDGSRLNINLINIDDVKDERLWYD